MSEKMIQQNKHMRVIFIIGAAILALAVLSFAISWPIWRVIAVVAGVIFSLFLPGFFMMKALFVETGRWRDLGKERPGETNSIDAVEAIIFSLFLSIALVAVCFTVLKQVGLFFSSATVVIVILGLNILTMIAALLRRAKK